MTLLMGVLLAAAPVGPYDTLCTLASRATAAAIVAREAGVPLDRVLTALDAPVDATARRLVRASVLSVYSEPRHGGAMRKADEAEFISQSTAMCIVQLEREAPPPVPIPTGVPLSTGRALHNLTGVK